MGSCFSREPIQDRDEGKGRTRPRQPMTLHEILREKEIANCREDRGEQDSDGRLPLVEQSPDEFECLLKVARGERVTELVDDAAARERYESANVFQSDLPFLGAEEEIEFLK